MSRFRTSTIRARLLIGFVLIALVPVISAAAGSMIIGIINGRQQAYERLQSVADSKEEAIKRWTTSVQQQLSTVSYSDCGYDRINVVVSLAQEDKYLRFYNQAIRNRFQGFLSQSKDLQEILLTDTSGLILLSTDSKQDLPADCQRHRQTVGPTCRYDHPNCRWRSGAGGAGGSAG